MTNWAVDGQHTHSLVTEELGLLELQMAVSYPVGAGN